MPFKISILFCSFVILFPRRINNIIYIGIWAATTATAASTVTTVTAAAAAAPNVLITSFYCGKSECFKPHNKDTKSSLLVSKLITSHLICFYHLSLHSQYGVKYDDENGCQQMFLDSMVKGAHTVKKTLNEARNSDFSANMMGYASSLR